MNQNNISPNVEFEVNIVNPPQPIITDGITHYVAVTEKGPIADPRTVINSISQFRKEYGSEVIPNNASLSNIEKSLELGSAVRISRVRPVVGTEGEDSIMVAYPVQPINSPVQPIENIDKPDTLVFEISNFMMSGRVELQLSKNPDFVNDNYSVGLIPQWGPVGDPRILTINIAIWDTKNQDEIYGNLKNDVFQYLYPLIALDIHGDTNGNERFMNEVTNEFITSNPNILVSATGKITGIIGSGMPWQEMIINNLQDFSDALGLMTIPLSGMGQMSITNYSGNTNYGQIFMDESSLDNTSNGVYDNFVFAVETSSGDATYPSDSWKEATMKLLTYDDSYQMILSHIHHHFTEDDLMGVYLNIGSTVIKQNNEILYIEIPSKNEDGTIKNLTEILSYKNRLAQIFGSVSFVSYFTGGIRYFDDQGIQRDCDSLGTVAGLAAKSEVEYGPWYSFAGLGRGKVTSAIGIVTDNYGSNKNLDNAKTLARESINMFTIKPSRQDGRVVTLWHNFTALESKSSFRFLGVTRMMFYIKKNIVPILEKYLEEPNIPATWNAIFYKAKPILDDMVYRQGLNSWEWYGDQEASSIYDVVTNKVQDILNGLYKIQLVVTEVVAMQQINIIININTVDSTITIES